MLIQESLHCQKILTGKSKSKKFVKFSVVSHEVSARILRIMVTFLCVFACLLLVWEMGVHLNYEGGHSRINPLL